MASRSSSGKANSSKGASQGSRKLRAAATPASSKSSSGGKSSKSSSGGTTGRTSTSLYQVYKDWGGAQNFALSYGLRLYNHDDCQEMKAIAREIAKNDNR